MPSFRQVGHCSLAVLPQPGVSQVPKVDIFQEHEDFGRAVTTVTPTLSLTTLRLCRFGFSDSTPKLQFTRISTKWAQLPARNSILTSSFDLFRGNGSGGG
jgi:hypothetical protein